MVSWFYVSVLVCVSISCRLWGSWEAWDAWDAANGEKPGVARERETHKGVRGSGQGKRER